MPAAYLWVAGMFTSPNRITRWDGTSFASLGTGANGLCNAVTRYQGNGVAAGQFTTVDSVSAARIAKYEDATSTWSPFGSGLGAECFGVKPFGDDLIAVGSFTGAGGVTGADYVARWTDGAWALLGAANDFKVVARGIAVRDDRLYVCGSFTLGNPSPSEFISRLDVNGSWEDLSTSINGTVFAMTVDANNNLIFGGQFTSVGGVASTFRLGKYDGTTWGRLDSGGTGANSDVLTLTPFDGKVAIGGNFTQLGGVSHNYVGLWNPASESFEALGTGMNGKVRGLKSYQGELYAVGDFTTADGATANRIAKWNKTSAAWSAVGSGLNAGAYALAVEVQAPTGGGAASELGDIEGSFERDIDDIRISLQGFKVYFDVVGYDIPMRTNVHTLDGVRRTLDVIIRGLKANNIVVNASVNVHDLREARKTIKQVKTALDAQGG